MTTYAMAERVPEGCTYLTAGKTYEVEAYWEVYFVMRDDNGRIVTLKWRKSNSLNGGDWTRLTEEQALTIMAGRVPPDEWDRMDAEVQAHLDALPTVSVPADLWREVVKCLGWYVEQMCEWSHDEGSCGNLEVDYCLGCPAFALLARIVKEVPGHG